MELSAITVLARHRPEAFAFFLLAYFRDILFLFPSSFSLLEKKTKRNSLWKKITIPIGNKFFTVREIFSNVRIPNPFPQISPRFFSSSDLFLSSFHRIIIHDIIIPKKILYSDSFPMQRPKKGCILTLNKYKWNHLCIFHTLSNPSSTRLTSRGSRNLPLHQILPREPLKPLCSLNDYVIPPSPFAIPRETHRPAIPDPRNHALLPPSFRHPSHEEVRDQQDAERVHQHRGGQHHRCAPPLLLSSRIQPSCPCFLLHSFPPRKVNRECGTDRER